MSAEASGERVIHAADDAEGERLDRFLTAAIPGLSRSEIQRLIKEKAVLVNAHPAKPAYRLAAGDAITVAVPPPEAQEVLPEDIPLDVLYEDADLVAVNKPAGMVVHPAFGNRSGTLVNAALARWPQMREVGGEERAGIVHRLDKETSGVIVLAKTPDALAALQAQFKARTIYKRYLALVEGVPASSEGIVEAPIGRDPKQRKRMAVVRDGRPATTRYDVLEDLTTHALLKLEPQTGRTHQIRVHLAWLGHPVVGDRVYGYRRQRIKMKRLFLHAAELHVDSPSAGGRLRFDAPLPVGLEDILTKLRRAQGGAW
jgi:23S rRNA pseudouridine1911/1915/1917 synthase